MSCHYPRTIIQDVNPDTGEITSRWTPALYYELSPDDIDLHYRVLPAACMSCAGCAADRAQMWTDRMCLEYDHTRKAVFLTLTYDDFYVPIRFLPDEEGVTREVYCLDKKALQDFQKRLRFHFAQTRLRFFSCGEMGSKSSRPHYHIIVFGLSLDDFGCLTPFTQNEFGNISFNSSVLSKLWTFGYSVVSDVSSRAFAYVAHYTTKKMRVQGDPNPNLTYADFPQEFAIMSRNPGIGGFFLEDHPEFIDDPEIRFQYNDPSDPSLSRFITLPKYLVQKFSDIDSDKYADLIARRADFAADAMAMRLRNSTLSPSELLNQDEQLKKIGLKGLNRKL